MDIQTKGFTLFEILVAVGLVLILTAVVLANVGSGNAQARDAERLSNLRNLENALERYRLQNGRYPEGCNGPYNWSGELGSDFDCGDDTNQYIVNLAPEFIPTLPVDPLRNGTNGGYVYSVDTNGDVFKIMALNTVENEVVELTSEFARCGNLNNNSVECAAIPNSPIGSSHVYNTDDSGKGAFPHCSVGDTDFRNDYAISRGYSSGEWFAGSMRTSEKAREYFTDQIRCK